MRDNETSLGELQKFIQIAKYANYFSICWESEDLKECIVQLRNTHYPLCTGRSYLFELQFIELGGAIWAVTSIPIDEKGNIEKIASDLNLKIESGFPETFTIDFGFITDHDNVFILCEH